MRVLPVIGGVLFISGTLTSGVSAQNIPTQFVQVVSTMNAPGQPVPNECREEFAILRRTIISYPHPALWRWIILCDDAGWEQFLRFSGRAGQSGIYGSTDLTAHATFLRGSTLLHPDDFRAQPAHVIAHELAHIVLSTSDEGRAEAQCRKWMREAGGQNAALLPAPKQRQR